MRHDCSDCGRPARVGGRQCARCYQRRYRSTEEGKRRHNDAITRYNARNPDKHRLWSRRWQQRTGRWSPDLQAVRAAINALDAALAFAAVRNGVRSSGQRGGDDGPQR